MPGTHDFICNWVGNERWTLDMPWSGQGIFRNKPLVDWTVDGHVAGKTRSHGGFTFRDDRRSWSLGEDSVFLFAFKAKRVSFAPKAPHDKPAESLSLINRWLYNERL